MRGKDDGAVAAPGATLGVERIGQHLCRAAFDLDPFELPVGKKPKRLTVGRPERIARAGRSVEGPRGSHSTDAATGRIGPRLRDERDGETVRRDRQRPAATCWTAASRSPGVFHGGQAAARSHPSRPGQRDPGDEAPRATRRRCGPDDPRSTARMRARASSASAAGHSRRSIRAAV